jgi:biotin synthase-like enzyme
MGEKLLTTPNPETDADRNLLDKLGMRLMPQTIDAAVPGV